MYRTAPKNFPDASELNGDVQKLQWSRENLYGLLFHQLGNHTGPEAERFRAVTQRKDEDGCVRFVAPVGLVADQERLVS